MTSDIIFRNILESMSDGVMTIDFEGRILTFNRAAEAILGMKQSDVLQKNFSEVFLINQENDEFNQTIFNAVYEANTIQVKTVPWYRGDELLTLEVTTSFLSITHEGSKKNEAVIVVFRDRTEVERLRQSEQRLTQELKEQHSALQKAYLEVEEANVNLQAALRKVQFIRIATTAFVIVFFLVIGVITWKQTGVSTEKSAISTKDRNGAHASRVYTVTPRPLTDSIVLKGTLKPIQIVNITSPFSGMVKEKYFEYGEAVTKGQLLLKLDVAETQVKYREAKTAFIEAQDKVNELRNWANSNEMARAQQNVTRSKLTLDGHYKTFQETERLYKKEIVPATEYDNAKQQYTTAKMDYEASLRELQIVKEKGEGQNLHIAELKLANARHRLQELESQLQNAAIVAPVSGTVLLPEIAGGKDSKGKVVDRGVTFSQGDILLSIGNTEGLSMTAEVDELEVLKIKKGQEVLVTVEAFGEKIKGKVFHVSSQAIKKESGRKSATFEVTVIMENLPEELKNKLRLGLSATMEIVVYHKSDVIMVPIHAVAIEGKDRFVTIRDRATQSLKKVKVETGLTTVDAVEIISGITSGDEVVY